MTRGRILSQGRQRLRGILMLALVAGVAGCPYFEFPDLLPDPPEEVLDLKGRIVTVGMPADNLPYSRIDARTGDVTGFDYEFIALLAQRLNFQPVFVAAEPPALLADLEAGRFDLAAGGIAYTLARAEAYDFAAPYGLVKLRLVVRAAESRVATIAEFRAATALRVGARRGTRTSELAVACCGAARVVGFDTTAAAVDALVAGAVDGVTLDDTELAGQQARSPGQLAVLPGPVAGDVAAYALPLGSDLTDALNAAAYQLQAEGATAALLAKWSR